MKQEYNTPDMTFVRLKHRDIITDSPQETVSMDFNASTSDWQAIGAADRYRDWE